jgi:hypothetical protein
MGVLRFMVRAEELQDDLVHAGLKAHEAEALVKKLQDRAASRGETDTTSTDPAPAS